MAVADVLILKAKGLDVLVAGWADAALLQARLEGVRPRSRDGARPSGPHRRARCWPRCRSRTAARLGFCARMRRAHVYAVAGALAGLRQAPRRC